MCLVQNVDASKEVCTLNEQRRLSSFFLLIAGALIVLLGFTGHLPNLPGAGADDPGPNLPDGCASEIYYQSYDAPTGSNFFGTSLEGQGADSQYEQMLARRCKDPVLTVAHLAYETGMWGDPYQLQLKVQDFINNPAHWRDAVDWLMRNEATCSRDNPTMSNRYQTLAMKNGSSRNIPPTLFQVTPQRPQFEVLRLTCDNGRVYNFKTNCGLQPVAQEFPNVPRTPVNPNPPPGTPPGTPPSPCTHNCGGTTTTTTCVNCTTTTTTCVNCTTTTTVCPTGPDGCKDPGDGINNQPGPCSIGDCGPRPVDPEPPAPDPVQPTATVAPPPSQPPPPSDPGPTQPTVTSTIPSPATIPD